MKLDTVRRIVGEPVGVCPFSRVADHLLDCRKRAQLPDNAASVLVFCYPYRVKEEPPVNICRYAAVPDYHGYVEERLEQAAQKLRRYAPESRFAVFTDNSPIPEVEAAVCAGMGVRGQNGLLITPAYGSYVFIGTVVTDLEIEATAHEGTCLNCGACRKACPVGLDKARCRSAVTQKKGALTQEEESLVIAGGLVWGCDTCAQVCPMNREKAFCTDPVLTQGYRDRYVPGESLAGRAYAWRGEGVLLRNAALLEKVPKKDK